MSKETKISAHHSLRLRNSYEDIHRLMKSIKSSSKNIDSEFYFRLINSNLEYPTWLKRQMIKLIRRRIKRVLDSTIKKKWFEFRLIVPRSKVAWVEDLVVPQGFFIKHLYFDSRSTFLTIQRISRNGKVKVFTPQQIAAYEMGTPSTI